MPRLRRRINDIALIGLALRQPLTRTESIRVVSSGEDANFYIRRMTHLTIAPGGGVISVVNNFETVCR